MPNISLNLSLIIALLVANDTCLADKVKEATETKVQYISLAPPLDRPKAQISGMTWCGDSLLLLPERPWFEVAQDNPDPEGTIATFVYQLSREQIDHYLSNKTASDKQKEPLIADKIKLEENGVRKRIKYFDGYEAIVCSGNKIWLSIETEIGEKTYETNIVGGTLRGKGNKKTINIDPSTLYRIESQSGIDNYSDEALLLDGNNLISIHEANNTRRDTPSFATRININSGARARLPFPSISFRITDTTALNPEGYFWGINYAWSGEQKWFTEGDTLAEEYGLGETHKLEVIVERLVQFRLRDDSIERVEQAPIQLQLTQEDGRNWEGVVRYGNKGLLLVTDQHPRTLLGFVPFD
jgi:hypothetical protein